MYKFSFIVPSYNSFKTISKTLDSILGLDIFVCIKEIIVVDCSDDDKTRGILHGYRHHPKCAIIELSHKSSPAASRNTGAAHATGDILCFIDSDVFLDHYWLERVEEASAAGCRLGAGSIGIPYFQQKNFLALAQLYLQFNEYLQTGKIRTVSMVPACNMFVDKKLFHQVGGFPALRASEDVVFCLKCAAHCPVWFVPQARCFHIFREEKRPFFQNQIILGKYIIKYRRQMYHQWYYQEPWSTLLLPFFLGLKTANIIRRIMKAGWAHEQNFIVSFPLFLAGLFYWSVGFYQGAHQGAES